MPDRLRTRNPSSALLLWILVLQVAFLPSCGPPRNDRIVIGTEVHSVELSGALTLVEAGPFGPAAYAALLAERLVDEPVILPASPDGRVMMSGLPVASRS